MEEAIEALDAALEFKDCFIQDKQKKLVITDFSLAQSSDPAQLWDVFRRLKELTTPEASELLVKYFNKVKQNASTHGSVATLDSLSPYYFLFTNKYHILNACALHCLKISTKCKFCHGELKTDCWVLAVSFFHPLLFTFHFHCFSLQVMCLSQRWVRNEAELFLQC